MPKKDEEILKILRRSRKAFLIEYACGLLLLVLLLILSLKGAEPPRFLTYLTGGLALLAFGSAEITRAFTSYTVTTEKVIITTGFFKKAQKNIHFIPLGFVPEINLKQGRLQRLLNYGTVFIHSSGENSFEVKDVDNPENIMQLIEDLIEKNRMGTRTRKR